MIVKGGRREEDNRVSHNISMYSTMIWWECVIEIKLYHIRYIILEAIIDFMLEDIKTKMHLEFAPYMHSAYRRGPYLGMDWSEEKRN